MIFLGNIFRYLQKELGDILVSEFQKKPKGRYTDLSGGPSWPCTGQPHPYHICYPESVMPVEIPGSEHTDINCPRTHALGWNPRRGLGRGRSPQLSDHIPWQLSKGQLWLHLFVGRFAFISVDTAAWPGSSRVINK